MKTVLLTWLDRLLVADVFVVILGFLWFAVAVVGESSGINLGYGLWQKLWIPVFNPAIGVLALGSLSSWGIKKVSGWLSKDQD